MIRAIIVVLILYMLGEMLAEKIGLAIPGATIGLLILMGFFIAQGGVDDGSAQVFDAFAPHFPLFFIPAAAGIVANLDVVAQNWFYILLAICLGTGVTIAFTGMLTQSLLPLVKRVSSV